MIYLSSVNRIVVTSIVNFSITTAYLLLFGWFPQT